MSFSSKVPRLISRTRTGWVALAQLRRWVLPDGQPDLGALVGGEDLAVQFHYHAGVQGDPQFVALAVALQA